MGEDVLVIFRNSDLDFGRSNKEAKIEKLIRSYLLSALRTLNLFVCA